MVIWNSLVSFTVVAGFFLFTRSLPVDTAMYEFGGLAFFAFPFFAVASILSLIAVITWTIRVRNKTYGNWYEYLSIVPSIPMFLTWSVAAVPVAKIILNQLR